MKRSVFRIYFKNEIANRLVFRNQLAVDIGLNALKLIVPVFTWYAVYRNDVNVEGYALNTMIAYLVIMNFMAFIFSMGHGLELASSIKSGKLSATLLRPISINNELLPKFMARILFNAAVILLPGYLIAKVFGFGTNFHFSIPVVLLISLNLIFCYLFSLLFGLTAFWLEEVWPLNHLQKSLIAIAGGLWFPLDLLPWNLGSYFGFSPFAHFGYVNGAVILGRLKDEEINAYILRVLVWILVSIVLYRFFLKKGLKKYEAVGG